MLCLQRAQQAARSGCDAEAAGLAAAAGAPRARRRGRGRQGTCRGREDAHGRAAVMMRALEQLAPVTRGRRALLAVRSLSEVHIMRRVC